MKVNEERVGAAESSCEDNFVKAADPRPVHEGDAGSRKSLVRKTWIWFGERADFGKMSDV